MSCFLCKQQCPTSTMTSYGSAAACKPCKSTYNRNNERMKGNAALRAWFRGMGSDQKAEWFADQKENHTRYCARKWDTTESFAETRRYVRTGENVIFDYVPLREWIKEERQLGFETDKAIASFKAAWKDPQALTKMHAGIQHVAIYRGIRSETGKGEDSNIAYLYIYIYIYLVVKPLQL